MDDHVAFVGRHLAVLAHHDGRLGSGSKCSDPLACRRAVRPEAAVAVHVGHDDAHRIPLACRPVEDALPPVTDEGLELGGVEGHQGEVLKVADRRYSIRPFTGTVWSRVSEFHFLSPIEKIPPSLRRTEGPRNGRHLGKGDMLRSAAALNRRWDSASELGIPWASPWAVDGQV